MINNDGNIPMIVSNDSDNTIQYVPTAPNGSVLMAISTEQLQRMNAINPKLTVDERNAFKYFISSQIDWALSMSELFLQHQITNKEKSK